MLDVKSVTITRTDGSTVTFDRDILLWASQDGEYFHTVTNADLHVIIYATANMCGQKARELIKRSKLSKWKRAKFATSIFTAWKDFFVKELLKEEEPNE